MLRTWGGQELGVVGEGVPTYFYHHLSAEIEHVLFEVPILLTILRPTTLYNFFI